MTRGRGSAVLILLSLMVLVLHCERTHAATYIVGGNGGWTYNTIGWPAKKPFKAGDILVFNYNPSFHNVAMVDRNGYSKCISPRSARVFKSGSDKIKLAKGHNYFICTLPGHCESNMKIDVFAA